MNFSFVELFCQKKVNFDKFWYWYSISDIYFNIRPKHTFDHEFKMAAANNVFQKQIEHFHSVGLF